MSMNINLVSSNIRFKAGNNNKKVENKTITGVELPGSKRLNYSPVTIGLLNGFCWGSASLLLEKGFSKITKSKSNLGLSLAINGLFGAFMGYRAYKFAKEEAKQA